MRRGLGRAGLAGLTAAGVAIATGAAGGPSPRLTPSSREGFPTWFAGPLGPLAPAPLGEEAFWLLVLAMSVCYLIVLASARAVGASLALGAIATLHLVFALAPPLLSTDAFGYLAVARASALTGAGPYSPVAEALARDPVLPYLVWQSRPNPYGPLFTAATFPLATLSVAGALWMVKGLAAGAGLALVALVARLADRLGGEALPAAVFVGLNPVLLVWAVGGGHNDLLLMVLVIGGLSLLVAGRERLGAAAAALAAGVKASVGVLLPLFVLGAKDRGRALVGAVVGTVIGAVLALVALGPELSGYPAALGVQAGLVSPNSVVDLVGDALGLGGATPTLRMFAGLALGASLLFLYLRTARGADPIAATGWAVVAMLLATSWLMPWYVVWVLPLAALAPGRGLRVAALALCAFVVAVRVPLPLG